MTTPAISLLFVSQRISPFHPLCTNIVREIAAYFPPLSLLPAVYSSYLVIYNMTTSSYKFIQISPISLSNRSVFCLLDGFTALAVSGNDPSTRVVTVSLITGIISAFPSMIRSRILPGVISIAGVVYVFGGLFLKQHLKYAEELVICEKAWKRLPDAHKSHYSFCPCHYDGIIYLSQSRIYHHIEVFTIASKTFHMTTLHGDTSYLRPVSIVVDGSLLLIGTNGYLIKWPIGAIADKTEIVRMEGMYGQIFEASCNPIRNDREIVWLDLDKPSKLTLNIDALLLERDRFALPA